MSWEGSDASVWNAERLRTASDAAGVALWSWNVDTNQISMDQRGHALWGITKAGPLTFEEVSSRIHPPDRERVRTVYEAARAKPGSYEIDFRITLDNESIRWVSARGLGADEFGILLDVTGRKEAEEAREMLADEMSHRIKNLFAIASSLTSLAARSAATTLEMEHDLQRRLLALSRAQNLIRPHPGEGGTSAQLGEVLLSPYDDRAAIGSRIHVALPDVRVGETATTVVALIVHELATNSVKYGSLSVASGSLGLSCAEHNGEVAIVWTERGAVRRLLAPSGGGFREQVGRPRRGAAARRSDRI